MVILIIAIEKFPKENYNLTTQSPHILCIIFYNISQNALYNLSSWAIFFGPQQVARSTSELQALRLTLKPMCHSTAVTESRLEIHLQCALLLTINKSITCLPFPWNYSHPWKKRILHTLDLFWSLALLPWQEHTISVCHFLHIQL